MSGLSVTAAALEHLSRHRSSLQQLYYPTLESEVVSEYMSHRRRHFSDSAWQQLLYGMLTSRTLYVGNLSFATREEQIHEVFTRVGPVRRVIMGLNAHTRQPCGFAFVEMESTKDAVLATRILTGLKLDERVLKADLDQVFEEGRQYGRGKAGGQIQDDHRADFDAGRGGWGAILAARKEREEAAARHKQAQLDQFGMGDEEEEEVYFDPTETIDRPRADDAGPMKLNASTIAALTPSVFPHYALPVDERVQQALEAHHAAAAAAQNAAAAPSAAEPAQRGEEEGDQMVDEDAVTPPPESLPASPPYKRSRQLSPRSPYSPHSPAPFGSASPQPFAARSPAPRSPGPRSPAPGSPAPLAASGSSPPWSPPSRGYTPRSELSDNDRTPPPEEEEGYDRSYVGGQHELADDDHTPPPVQEEEEELADDAATPPPADHDDDEEEDERRRREHEQHDSHAMDFDSFER